MPLHLQISIILRSISNAKFKNYGEHFNLEQNKMKNSSFSREKMSAMHQEGKKLFRATMCKSYTCI